jgi:hypothetical protein
MKTHEDVLQRAVGMTSDAVVLALRRSDEELEPVVESALALQTGRHSAQLISLILEEVRGPGAAPWGAIHAARALGDDRFAPATDALVEALLATDPEQILHDAAVTALGKIGPPAAPRILAALESAGPDARSGLIGALADTRHPDARVLPILLEQLASDPIGGAGNLVDYGDQAALPRLSERLDALEVPVEAEHAFAPDQAIIEVASAIEDLGGTLTPDQRRKLERVRSRRNVFRGLLEAARASTPPPPVVATPKHGRNAPCWCGSGRKYKKCHLSEDEEGRAPAGGPPAGG